MFPASYSVTDYLMALGRAPNQPSRKTPRKLKMSRPRLDDAAAQRLDEQHEEQTQMTSPIPQACEHGHERKLHTAQINHDIETLGLFLAQACNKPYMPSEREYIDNTRRFLRLVGAAVRGEL